MKDENDNFPMKLVSLNGFTHSLLIKPREENSEANIFFQDAFARRDIQRGENAFVERIYDTREGRILNFSLREICETFFDRYSGHTLANYFETKAEPNSDLTKLVDDLKFADEFYTKAFVINLTSGSGGRWEYWQLYIPGLETEEINALLPKSLLSKSKYSENEIPAGHSALLKRGIGKDYYHKLMQDLGYRVSEKEYFLSKVTAARLPARASADDYYSYLCSQKTNNTDKTYLRFMKKWHHPIILIDNHKETELPIHLDTLTLKEKFAQTTYPIFYDSYPIPDCGRIVINPQMPKDKMSLFESIYALSESIMSGNFGLKEI
jgi:hypothetical protein